MDKLPEWPTGSDHPFDAKSQWQLRAEYWESRCRVAVEALETIQQSDQANGVDTTHIIYTRALEAILPLPAQHTDAGKGDGT
jgi:hypothetical protein